MAKRKADDAEFIISDSDDVCKTPPKKLASMTQKRREQLFRAEYSEKWPYLVPGKCNKFALCKVCDCEFSIAHGGKDDCRRHVESKKHERNEENAKSLTKCQKISGFFESQAASSGSESVDNDVIRAEVMMVDLITEVNLPISLLDKITPALKLMFKDSAIAKKFQCTRSKGTAIIKEIAAQTVWAIGDRLKSQPFTISTDGSNDSGSQKMYPLVVRTYDKTSLLVRSELLSLAVCEGSGTGKLNVSVSP